MFITNNVYLFICGTKSNFSISISNIYPKKFRKYVQKGPIRPSHRLSTASSFAHSKTFHSVSGSPRNQSQISSVFFLLYQFSPFFLCLLKHIQEVALFLISFFLSRGGTWGIYAYIRTHAHTHTQHTHSLTHSLKITYTRTHTYMNALTHKYTNI